LKAFLDHCSKKVGDAYFRTPRTVIRAFVDLLAVLEQNPQLSWQSLLNGVQVDADTGAEQAEGLEEDSSDAPAPLGIEESRPSDDDLSSFRL
jgi:hypothetical protein